MVLLIRAVRNTLLYILSFSFLLLFSFSLSFESSTICYAVCFYRFLSNAQTICCAVCFYRFLFFEQIRILRHNDELFLMINDEYIKKTVTHTDYRLLADY